MSMALLPPQRVTLSELPAKNSRTILELRLISFNNCVIPKMSLADHNALNYGASDVHAHDIQDTFHTVITSITYKRLTY